MHKFLILLLTLSSPLAYAGKLDDFEASASKPKKKKSSSSSIDVPSSTGSSVGDEIILNVVGSIVEVTAKVAAGTLALGTIGSLNKTNDRLGEAPFDPKWNEGKLSDYAIPIVQADISYGFADDFEWKDGRFEAGLGPISVFYRESEYIEPEFDSRLNIINSGFNYRLFFGNRVEADFGFGSYQLKGSQEYKSDSLQFGLNIQLTDKVWLDYNRASVSGKNLNLADSEYALIYGKEHYFIRLLYRSMDSEETSLDGLGIGLTLLY